ncbi:MAG: tetratricopeptide repeat protein [Anaerolineales bacterium]|nr:tetratricopeptide repeat protein [Anaerolineales bacterium]
MTSEHIIEVTEASFQNDVIVYSNTVPVVVDLWAQWCQPCHLLTPILEKLAREMKGGFRLAKVNADENPNLIIQLSVRSLPTIKAFYRGQLVNEFVGLQSEAFVRTFLRNLVPAASNLELERAEGLLGMKNYQQAALAFQKTLKSDPDNGAALLGLAKSLLLQGETVDALAVLMDFPASKQLSDAESLADLARSISLHLENPESVEEHDLMIGFVRSLSLVAKGNLPAAADGFLGILRQNKNYCGGEVRRAMVGLLVLMDQNDPDTRQYRNELASVLF